jgi:hypothetical protein
VGDVLRLVSAAAAIKALPKDLTPDLQSAAKEGGGQTRPEFSGCHVGVDAVVQQGCVIGDPAGSRTVFLLGDSHAAMWVTAFDSMGKSLHWKVIAFTKSQCPALSVSISRNAVAGEQKASRPYPECGRWLDDVILRIGATSPDLVVLASASCEGCPSDADGRPLTNAAWAAGLQKTLGRITSSNTRKVVLGEIPHLAVALDCLATHEDNVQACSKPVRTAVGQTLHDVERAAATQAGAEYIDVFPWFCSSVCTAVIGNMVVYTNDQHLASAYASYLSGALGAVLQPIMDRR